MSSDHVKTPRQSRILGVHGT